MPCVFWSHGQVALLIAIKKNSRKKNSPNSVQLNLDRSKRSLIERDVHTGKLCVAVDNKDRVPRNPREIEQHKAGERQLAVLANVLIGFWIAKLFPEVKQHDAPHERQSGAADPEHASRGVFELDFIVLLALPRALHFLTLLLQPPLVPLPLNLLVLARLLLHPQNPRLLRAHACVARLRLLLLLLLRLQHRCTMSHRRIWSACDVLFLRGAIVRNRVKLIASRMEARHVHRT
mmetsp:Transcript_15496/g.41618  ORF Transcript_15496/g.41618 Transcript_15496/m.41618 type:complete len:233 (-) Transcript_15496:71-769(-)